MENSNVITLWIKYQNDLSENVQVKIDLCF